MLLTEVNHRTRRLLREEGDIIWESNPEHRMADKHVDYKIPISGINIYTRSE